jgi:hypothetical protein
MTFWGFCFWFIVFAMLFASLKYLAVAGVVIGGLYWLKKRRR